MPAIQIGDILDARRRRAGRFSIIRAKGV